MVSGRVLKLQPLRLLSRLEEVWRKKSRPTLIPIMILQRKAFPGSLCCLFPYDTCHPRLSHRATPRNGTLSTSNLWWTGRGQRVRIGSALPPVFPLLWCQLLPGPSDLLPGLPTSQLSTSSGVSSFPLTLLSKHQGPTTDGVVGIIYTMACVSHSHIQVSVLLSLNARPRQSAPGRLSLPNTRFPPNQPSHHFDGHMTSHG